MLAFISPAKRQEAHAHPAQTHQSLCEFASQSWILAQRLQALSETEMTQLMHISPKLAALNVERLRDFSPDAIIQAPHRTPAVLLYQGDTYRGLQAQTLTTEDLLWAQDHLRLLSGLYGATRPLDGILPYRLEMGCKLSHPTGNTLYEYWGETLTHYFQKLLEQHSTPCLINLASHEYSRVLHRTSFPFPIIDITFQNLRQGQRRTIGLLSKFARGAMARFIIQHRIDQPEALKAFDQHGYRFETQDSTSQHYVFVG